MSCVPGLGAGNASAVNEKQALLPSGSDNGLLGAEAGKVRNG